PTPNSHPPTPSAPPPTPSPPRCPLPGCGARVEVRADGEAACVYCGCRVVITVDGRALAWDGLLYGACTCCVPRRPLIRQGEALICLAQPARRYDVPVPGPTPELDWQAIDTALRQNSAQLGRHGLFVRDPQRRE
ncbi:MAG TPA: hypothetical protein VKY74_07390, partial [Chloroflexia bacterium]|nr:hypothetical protein [Chloroflexia bacterium]